MARKKARNGSSSTPPTLAPEQASQLLRSHCEKGRQLLKSRPITSSNEQAWEAVVQDLLVQAFGSLSPNVERILAVGRLNFAFGGGNETEWEAARAETMTTRLEILDGLIDLLDSEANLAAAGSVSSAQPSSSPDQIRNTVFLVHGHDEAAIHEVARLLEQLDLEVIILREQPNSGRTIIEKFVDYSNVGFAVVLLTGDDRGGAKSLTRDEQKLRARQNVILELGFFLGRLGRNRVCVLHQADVEIPSDYSGVLFLPLDPAGAWRLALARELKAAGLDVNMNKAV